MPEPTPMPEPRETRVKPTWKTWAIVGIWAFYPEVFAGIVDTIWIWLGGYRASITHHSRVAFLYYPVGFSVFVGLAVGMLACHFTASFRGADPTASYALILSAAVGWALMFRFGYG